MIILTTTHHGVGRGFFGNMARVLYLIVIVYILQGCSSDHQVQAAQAEPRQQPSASTQMHVFKSPTCGCCGKWVDHIEAAGFLVDVENTQNMSAVKTRYNIEPRHQSCHTGVAEGYIFEGHIPAEIVKRFLAERPQDAIGLSVAGMPAGSPGMEMGNRHDAYDVLLLKKDKSVIVYHHVSAL